MCEVAGERLTSGDVSNVLAGVRSVAEVLRERDIRETAEEIAEVAGLSGGTGA